MVCYAVYTNRKSIRNQLPMTYEAGGVPDISEREGREKRICASKEVFCNVLLIKHFQNYRPGGVERS